MQYTHKGIKKFGKARPKILGIAGPLILTLTLLAWILLLWTGWTFIFAGGETVLTDTRNNDPIFITLGATYVLSVLSAVTQQRSFADSVPGMGKNSHELVQKAWNGQDLSNIDLFLSTSSSMLSQLTAQHKAYPILHCYHSESKEKEAPYAIAVLEDTLTIMKEGMEREAQPNLFLVEKAKSSISSYLDTLVPSMAKPATDPTALPNLEKIEIEGLPTVRKKKLNEAFSNNAERRKKLPGIMHSSMLDWPK